MHTTLESLVAELQSMAHNASEAGFPDNASTLEEAVEALSSGTPEQSRDVMLRELELAARTLQVDGITASIVDVQRYAQGVAALRDLAQTAALLDGIHARSAQTRVEPAINVERLANAVWHAAQDADGHVETRETLARASEAGIAATAIADIAATAVRKVLA